MTLEEVKALKKEAEKIILEIIHNFEKRTELSVQSVNIEKSSHMDSDRSSVDFVQMKVTLGA